jgi:DUF438 domain-containing protein
MPGEVDPQALDVWGQLAVAVTVLDLEGRLLYYNDYAAAILDRRPEYLGRDVRELHQPASAEKITRILESYRHGSRQEEAWTLSRAGRRYGIRVAPWVVEGRPAGLVHAAMLLAE